MISLPLPSKLFLFPFLTSFWRYSLFILFFTHIFLFFSFPSFLRLFLLPLLLSLGPIKASVPRRVARIPSRAGRAGDLLPGTSWRGAGSHAAPGRHESGSCELQGIPGHEAPGSPPIESHERQNQHVRI